MGSLLQLQATRLVLHGLNLQKRSIDAFDLLFNALHFFFQKNIVDGPAALLPIDVVDLKYKFVQHLILELIVEMVIQLELQEDEDVLNKVLNVIE